MELSELDRAWARSHDWIWNETDLRFRHKSDALTNPFIHVTWNWKSDFPGWVIYLAPCGIIQERAPWGSVRAALRTAEAIRLGRFVKHNEMDCSEDPTAMEVLAYASL